MQTISFAEGNEQHLKDCMDALCRSVLGEKCSSSPGSTENANLEGILRGNLYVALIAEYKAAGRRKEIEGALKALHRDSREAAIPEDLCFVYGVYPEDYLHDVEICQRFAPRSRERMAEIILGRYLFSHGGVDTAATRRYACSGDTKLVL